MLRPLKSVSPRISREAKRLIDWCIALDQSGSRLEDQFWEVKIIEALDKILKSGKEKPLETALEHLSEHHHGGFEALIELAENLSSSCIVEVQGNGVWTALGYEAGTHQVKRVPATEAQGRIHTSTATVAVMAEPEEVESEVDPAEVKEMMTTAQGPGKSVRKWRKTKKCSS